MADATSPKKSIWLASGITVAVVIVLAAIFVGPKVVECAGSDAGFGSCVRQALVDAGVVPPAATDGTKSTDVAEGTEADEAVKAAADAAAVADLAPDFNVRVEPDGSFIVAGSAPGSQKVEIYVNDILVGTEKTVGDAADWVFVPQNKLDAGGSEIRIIMADKDQTMDKSYVVMIDKDATVAPLVVASLPGEASQILQGLMTPDATTAVAAADPAAPQVTEPVSETPAQVAVAPETVVEPVAQNADAASDAINMAVAGTLDDQTAALSAPPAIEIAAIEPTSPEASAPAQDTQTTEPATSNNTNDAATTVEVAATDAAEKVTSDLDNLAAQVEALKPMMAPTIDAIEIDAGRNYFAGGGEEGATIRLYVDNKFIADTIVRDGRWLFDLEAILANRTQRIRVDQLAANSSDVAGRAEVDFIFEAPAAETAVASADEKAIEPEIVVPTPDFSIDTEVPVVVAQDQTTEAPTEVAVASEQAVVEQAPATTTSAATETAAAPVVETPVADTPVAVATAPAITEEAETPGAEVPQMVAQSVGNPEDQRYASGKAIIRKGDNLWTIARRIYGSGPRYTVIYQANSQQIRDPNLIYPGQVFVLPDTDQTIGGN